MKKRSLIVAAILFVAAFAGVNIDSAFGAAAPPPPQTCWPPPCIPIDGGISILIAAGAAFGGKKIYDLRKK
jgi:hypothetical protein